jgi:hypothetical protein
MTNATARNMTERQRKWFASVREGLHKETGKTLAEWVAIAMTCPENRPRARLKWFKETHGLLQNRAMYVLREAFPSKAGWDEPDALQEARALVSRFRPMPMNPSSPRKKRLGRNG